MRLLVVEDDASIAEPLIDGLTHHGFEVKHVPNGVEAIAAVRSGGLDLVLLDLGLPDIDGLDVCRDIRRISNVPVIVVTARSSEVDRVVGLELGADDYVVKPFGIRELVARIRAVLRRFDGVVSATSDSRRGDLSPVILGDLEVDVRAHRVFIGSTELALTPKEFGVIALLAADVGAVVTRSSLIEQVWDEHWYGPTKTLDVHIAQLRQKLGDPRWIETVRGVGFRLAVPADQAPLSQE